MEWQYKRSDGKRLTVSQPADDYICFCGNGNANDHLGAGLLVHKGIRSAVEMVKFISDMMYMSVTLRGRW
jgi:hypothetical protein